MLTSKYIRKLAFINIAKKKQRTFLSIVAVSLSVAIIFISLTLFSNVYSLTKIPNNITTGNYHYILKSDEGDPLTRHHYTYDYELEEYGYYGDNKIAMHQLETSEDQSPLPIIIEGTYPQNDSEILVPSDFGAIGDTIQFDTFTTENNTDIPYAVAKEVFNTNPTDTKEFTIVGTYEPTTLFTSLTGDVAPVYVANQNLNQAHRNIIITDNQIQRSDSVGIISEVFSIDTQGIQLNSDAISYDTVRNYLKDTTTLLIMFIVIIILAILISVISLKNVFIITDKDRKKEFGLLKSVGATPKDISTLLKIELSSLGAVGAIIGIFFGLIISFFVLKAFVQELSIAFNIQMILNPMILIVSFLIGFVLMVGLGYFSYRHYIHSSAIDDLKDVAYNYDPPRQKQSYRAKSFSWKMFLIYNGRLKKQTRNIFQSFLLLILTTVLFFAVFLSNHDYRTETDNADYDFEISNEIASNSATPISLELYDHLYASIDNGDIIPSSVNIQRLLLGPYIQYPVEAINQDSFRIYQLDSRVNYVESTASDGQNYGQIQTTNLLLDDEQIERLQPYVAAGSLDDLADGGVVVILQKGSNVSEGLLGSLQPGSQVYLTEDLDDSLKEEIKAVVLLDPEATDLYCDYSTYSRVVAMSSSYGIKYQENPNFYISESAQIVLDNKATLTKATMAIDQAITESGQENNYTYDNVLLRAQENNVISFLLESLLYPLFLLLFVISLLNINNVLIGNIHLKQGDISIMKSVGMTSYQLYRLFIFEYLEGYLNASFWTIVIFIPICLLESRLGLSSAFKLGENIVITLLVGIAVIDLVVVTVLVMISLNKIRKVQAIENMKDVV